MALDTFSHFTYANTNIPDSLYYYYIDPSMLTSSYFAIPPVDAVVSVTSMPYIKNLSMRSVDYDMKRFPLAGFSDQDEVVKIPLQRIMGHEKSFFRYQLGEFTPYPSHSISEVFNWRNESKLYQYPYMYGIINDGLSTPLEIKYHQCGSNQVWTHSTLNPTGTYSLYVKDYCGDTYGMMYGQTNTSGAMLPTVSSAYTNYMSQNKAQHQLGKLNGAMSMISGGISGAMVGGWVGAIGGVVANSTNILNSFAKEKDLSRTPNTLKTQGSDLTFDLLMSDVSSSGEARNKLTHYRMAQRDEFMERVGWFFHMYGYKQNKVMKPNIKSRSRYNYIKCDANIKGNVDNDVIVKLREIYDKGVTFWHVDDMLDYSLDNKEM